MNSTAFIEKYKQLKESEDHAFLREKGIEYIQQLAHQIWTDYNVHDPGITILEMLCYAMTDLGYRTSYLIQDILAEDPSGEGLDIENFFSARHILPCNPVTFNDFRKMMIDVPGVKNAWLEIVETQEPRIFVDCRNSRLTLEEHEKFVPLDLQGLYDVILEFEADAELGDLNLSYFTREVGDDDTSFSIEVVLPAWDTYFNQYIDPKELSFEALTSIAQSQKYEGTLHVTSEDGKLVEYPITVISHAPKTESNTQLIQDELNRTDQDGLLAIYKKIIKKTSLIANDVFQTLYNYRNLCEDFLRFKAIEIEEIAICADLEVSAEADIEAVLAEMYYQVGHFLDPTVKFYSIQELMEKGKTADEIFEGPILQHGFIDDAELEVSKLKTPIHTSDSDDTASECHVIHVSDIIQIIMDVEGVVAVKNIMLTNFYQGEPQTTGEKWQLKIGPGRATRLSRDRSKIVFYKGLIPYAADHQEVQERLKELLALDRHNRLEQAEYDLDIPEGEHRAIQTYYSIQHDFPLYYGIGEEGLPRSATTRRKAQAKQLKAYLLLYDQLLANYFAQLAHIKDLFSMNPDIKKTYFSQPLYDIPGVTTADIPNIDDLFIDVEALKVDFLDSINEREEMLENQAMYEDRKNRFLDHLMARFGEQFTEYVLLTYSLDRKKAPTELIADKFAFLHDYPEISRNRGKAFNYKDPTELWNSENVSGLQKRVSRLLGIKSYIRRSLADCVDESADCEGFHLIEHILLRPRTKNDRLLTVCVNEDCNTCSGFIDPYSFRMTAIAPYWPERFKNFDFRRFFESTIRMEAPAHVHVKICWVDQEAMQRFEETYVSWLETMAEAQPNQEELTTRQNELINALESLRSVYPEARLYDCEEGTKTNPVLLNHTILGTTERDEA